ncbi:hypothetical protein TKK_0011651 [Trichogramma kaykai]|uniref:BESS domain-containing protein n=1 Tax=Trichogramma kaykai TaxID=54128 RepID=A0ABD2WQN7_9HYME
MSTNSTDISLDNDVDMQFLVTLLPQIKLIKPEDILNFRNEIQNIVQSYAYPKPKKRRSSDDDDVQFIEYIPPPKVKTEMPSQDNKENIELQLAVLNRQIIEIQKQHQATMANMNQNIYSQSLQVQLGQQLLGSHSQMTHVQPGQQQVLYSERQHGQQPATVYGQPQQIPLSQQQQQQVQHPQQVPINQQQQVQQSQAAAHSQPDHVQPVQQLQLLQSQSQQAQVSQTPPPLQHSQAAAHGQPDHVQPVQQLQLPQSQSQEAQVSQTPPMQNGPNFAQKN